MTNVEKENRTQEHLMLRKERSVIVGIIFCGFLIAERIFKRPRPNVCFTSENDHVRYTNIQGSQCFCACYIVSSRTGVSPKENEDLRT